MKMFKLQSLTWATAFGLVLVSFNSFATGDQIHVTGKATWGIESTHVVSAIQTPVGASGTIMQIFNYEGKSVHLIADVECVKVVGDIGFAVGTVKNATNTDLFVPGGLRGYSLAIIAGRGGKFTDVFYSKTSAKDRCAVYLSRGYPLGLESVLDTDAIQDINGTVIVKDGDE